MNLLVVFPAYGRVYDSPQAIKQDFLQGKDFSPWRMGDGYLSVRDFIDNVPALADYAGVVLSQSKPVYLEVSITRNEMENS